MKGTWKRCEKKANREEASVEVEKHWNESEVWEQSYVDAQDLWKSFKDGVLQACDKVCRKEEKVEQRLVGRATRRVAEQQLDELREKLKTIIKLSNWWKRSGNMLKELDAWEAKMGY